MSGFIKFFFYLKRGHLSKFLSFEAVWRKIMSNTQKSLSKIRFWKIMPIKYSNWMLGIPNLVIFYCWSEKGPSPLGSKVFHWEKNLHLKSRYIYPCTCCWFKAGCNIYIKNLFSVCIYKLLLHRRRSNYILKIINYLINWLILHTGDAVNIS